MGLAANKNMDPIRAFRDDCRTETDAQGASPDLRRATLDWMSLATPTKYSYHFEWLGRPIIQYPQDIVAFQELVHRLRPTVIVETGIAHGGSLVLSASLLALLDVMEGVDPWKSERRVIGVDIDIRAHNRAALDAHPLRGKMELIQGSSISPDIVEQVFTLARTTGPVLVSLDSNHSHEHVLAELNAYGPLVSPGSYCVVFDTVVEDLPPELSPANRPWTRGDNPKTAVREYLARSVHEPQTAVDGAPLRFEVDTDIDNKLLISMAPGGFLRRI